MIPSLDKLPEQFIVALKDSYELLKLALPVETEYEYNSNIPIIYSFPQSHSNTGGGWEKANQIVGHAFVGFWVIVVEYHYLNAACVYINGRAAYICETNETYKEYIQQRQMPLWNQIDESKLNLLWHQR